MVRSAVGLVVLRVTVAAAPAAPPFRLISSLSVLTSSVTEGSRGPKIPGVRPTVRLRELSPSVTITAVDPSGGLMVIGMIN
jgi:hypothetical protein